MTVNKSFRIGKVRGDLRGKICYLTYQEEGQRKRLGRGVRRASRD